MAYSYDDATGNDVNNAAHALIERPMTDGEPHYVAAIEDIKYSRLCSCISWQTPRMRRLPAKLMDGSSVIIPPGAIPGLI